jgi:hypothetical protein
MGRPAIAYMTMTYVAPPPESPDDAGTMRTSLRLARASTDAPAGPDDWGLEVLDELVAPVTDGFEDLPVGTGLHASLGFTSDGTAHVAYYRQTGGDLMLAVIDADGLALVELDGGADRDRGQYASLAVGSDDVVRVAYQDAIDDTLLSTTYADATVGAIELVDDGRREGDRPHAVGAAARVVWVGDAPVVAYQDGTTAELLWSTRDANGAWSGGTIMTGDAGYGFHIAAAARDGGVWCSTYAYDQSHWPPGHTEVRRLEL